MKKINNAPCQIYPEYYEQLFSSKCENVERKLLAVLSNTAAGIAYFPSPKAHFRGRIEFAIGSNPSSWLCYDAQKKPVIVDHCPTVIMPIYERMPPFLQYIQTHSTFAHRLFQVNWRATLQGKCLLSLLYHRPLDNSWYEQATVIAKELDMHVIGRSRGKERVVGENHIDDEYTITDASGKRNITLRQDDVSFSQPNPYINAQMLSWVQAHIPNDAKDLLELYCGSGNFSCALAPRFRKVLATELTRSAVALCKHNLIANNINNVSVVRLSDSETAQALSGERCFNRLKGVDVHEYDFQWLFLDPPRQGLSDRCRRFATKFNNIIYFSCNPNEAIYDLQFWQEHFSVATLAFFDQFPYTAHLEMGIILKKR